MEGLTGFPSPCRVALHGPLLAGQDAGPTFQLIPIEPSRGFALLHPVGSTPFVRYCICTAPKRQGVQIVTL